MMQDPRTGEWLPYPNVLPIPDRARDGRLCPVPRPEKVEDVEELVDEITVRRRR